jgi:hypothetical protein
LVGVGVTGGREWARPVMRKEKKITRPAGLASHGNWVSANGLFWL